jgi:hypothetical protein
VKPDQRLVVATHEAAVYVGSDMRSTWPRGQHQQAREPAGPSCHARCVRNGRASPARRLRTTLGRPERREASVG